MIEIAARGVLQFAGWRMAEGALARRRGRKRKYCYVIIAAPAEISIR